MNIVALRSLPESRETLSGTLVKVLGKTPYEVSSRLRVIDKGPLVLATFADQAAAENTAYLLRKAGLDALILTGEELDQELKRHLISTFEFTERQLLVSSAQGQSLALDYGDVRVILRGVQSTTHTSTETVKERKLDLGMAALTGGLKLSKTETTKVETTTDDREGFLNLYPADNPVITLRESRLNYNCLGQDKQPVRALNFNITSSLIRSRCPSAAYDDRLMNKKDQTQLLGPLLNPETHMHIATALLFRVLLNRQR